MPRGLIRLLAGVLPVLAVLIGPGAAESTDDGVSVRIADGWLRGSVHATHRSFQGIPYAAPPVGELRWQEPQPAAAWSGVRDATVPGAACPQPGAVGQEDCLSLNVTTPRRVRGPLPVLVFVHGGGFVGGAGEGYDPARLSAQGDVVVVTMNYRLGALGFLAHPALGETNVGLADQQAALGWVRDNIAAFGGNPGNVTLWGESAGAISTCAQLAAPGARGLFHKAIVQSGPCGNPVLDQAEAYRRGVAIAERLGCTGDGAAACLRGKPAAELTGLHRTEMHTAHRRLDDLPWLPVAGTDTLPVQPPEALRLGLTADVPLIHGGTADEMRPFVAGSHTEPLTADGYAAAVADLYGDDAEAVLAEYPPGPHPRRTLATLLTDDGGMLGACAQLPTVEAAARRSPVYAYEFAEPIGYQLGGLPFGAAHGADLPYLFDIAFPGPPLTPAQQTLADRLIGYWSSFARTGDPGLDWPVYADGLALSLAADQAGPVDLAERHRCDFWRGLR